MVRIDPEQPTGSVDQGYFEAIVTARNNGPDSVVVVLPPSSDAAPPPAFRYAWRNGSGGLSFDDRAWDREAMIFAPGEIKQRVFDLHIGGDCVLAGSDTVRGAYGSRWSAPLVVTVSR
jgi:hypothetical protein